MATVDEGAPLWGMPSGVSTSGFDPAMNDTMQLVTKALALLGPQNAPKPGLRTSILGGLGDALTAAAMGRQHHTTMTPGVFTSGMEQKQREFEQGQQAARAHVIGSVLGQLVRPRGNPVYKVDASGRVVRVAPDGSTEFVSDPSDQTKPLMAQVKQPPFKPITKQEGGHTVAYYTDPLRPGTPPIRVDYGTYDPNVTYLPNADTGILEAYPTKAPTGTAAPNAPAEAPDGAPNPPSPGGPGGGKIAPVGTTGAARSKPVTQAQIGLDKSIEVLHNLRETFDNVRQMFRVGHGYKIDPQSGEMQLLSPQEQSQTIHIGGVPGQPPAMIKASPNNRAQQLLYGTMTHWGDLGRGIVSEDLPGGALAANHEGIRGKLVAQMIPQLTGQARAVVGLLQTFEGYIPPWTYGGSAAEAQFADADRTLYEAEQALKALKAGKPPDQVQQNINSFLQSAQSGLRPSFMGESGNKTEDEVVARPAEMDKRRAEIQSRLDADQKALAEYDRQVEAVNGQGANVPQKFAGHSYTKAKFDQLSPEDQQRWIAGGGTVKSQ